MVGGWNSYTGSIHTFRHVIEIRRPSGTELCGDLFGPCFVLIYNTDQFHIWHVIVEPGVMVPQMPYTHNCNFCSLPVRN